MFSSLYFYHILLMDLILKDNICIDSIQLKHSRKCIKLIYDLGYIRVIGVSICLRNYTAVFNNEYIFVSRGDDSGTHKKELELWKSININPNHFKKLRYLNVGQGMGNTLLITNEKFAYTIVDRASWISFKKKENLKIICESHPPLFNQYGLILVNPAINNKLNYSDAKIYVDWLISEKGKYLINNFKKNGKQLFFYNFE